MLDTISKNGFGIVILASAVVLIFPVPFFIQDFLLLANFSVAMLVLLLSVSAKEPLAMSTFPSLLVFTTIFRIAINVSSLRLILTYGFAGNVIEGFGNFVIGSNVVVGLLIFAVLAIFYIIVVSQGINRLSEVAARFALDTAPAKQLAIESGKAEMGRERYLEEKANLQKEIGFYGAMDGAGKYVKGDAIMGVVILVLSFVGGIIIGLTNGMSIQDAIHTYTTLTIGDGLVTIIPSILISSAAASLVTRGSPKTSLTGDILSEIVTNPSAFYVAAAVVAFLGVLPGFPLILAWIVAGALGYFGWYLQNRAKKIEAKSTQKRVVPIDPGLVKIRLELGFATTMMTGVLKSKIEALRGDIKNIFGINLPGVLITDNTNLRPEGYRIVIRNNQVAKGEIVPNSVLAIDVGSGKPHPQGKETIYFETNRKAWWINPDQEVAARADGYVVIDNPTVIANHLRQAIVENISEIVDREEIHKMFNEMMATHPAVAQEVSNNKIPWYVINQVIRNLLAERAPVKDFPAILEAILDWQESEKSLQDLTNLTRSVRVKIRNSIVIPLSNEGILSIVRVTPEEEERIYNWMNTGKEDNEVLFSIAKRWDAAKRATRNTICLVTIPQIRAFLFNKINDRGLTGIGGAFVLSPEEIPYGIKPVEVLSNG